MSMGMEYANPKRKRLEPYTRAGPVKITRRDGTTEVHPPYIFAALHALVDGGAWHRRKNCP